MISKSREAQQYLDSKEEIQTPSITGGNRHAYYMTFQPDDHEVELTNIFIKKRLNCAAS